MPGRPEWGRSNVRRALASVEDGVRTFFRRPNLMIGTGMLLMAAFVAYMARPQPGPPKGRTTVVQGTQSAEQPLSASPGATSPTAKASQSSSPPVSPNPAAKTPVAQPAAVAPVSGRLLAGYAFVYEKPIGEWEFHRGWDLAASEGTPVKAALAGKVTAVEQSPSLGLEVRVASGDVTIIYAGLGQSLFKVGQTVQRGEDLATVGAPGRLEAFEGPHLHVAVLKGGTPVNPATILPH